MDLDGNRNLFELVTAGVKMNSIVPWPQISQHVCLGFFLIMFYGIGILTIGIANKGDTIPIQYL